MFKSSKLLRATLLGLPLLIASMSAIFMASANVGTPPTTPTQISDTNTMSMANYEAYPSGVNALAAPNVPPLIMLAMSRDEQLFNKAYPDFTDLDGDGVVDTTYVDSFAYNGYFDPGLCYSYDSTNKYYKAATQVTVGTHKCASGNSYWSGNFLNWIAMSRVDVLRWTFYGGTRSTDTATKTVLERAEITNDLHAWAKVYSGSDIASLAPFTTTTTFCNVSLLGSGSWGGWNAPSQTSSGITTTPVIRTASGAWGDWASTAKVQCQPQQSTDDGGNSGRPAAASTDYTARVQVCQNLATIPNESICVTDGSALKPEGLLQKYSKNDSNVKRFGLVTGSAYQARIGGQLRRNIGQLANNVTGTACAAGTGTGDGDEFSNVDGTFCYKSATSTPKEGIVQTLDRLQISGWNGSDYGDSYGASGDTTCHSASNPWGARGIDIQAKATMCPDFGNPLAGMYAQALRYIQGSTVANSESLGKLPNPDWVDPYGTASGATTPRNQPCASCSIVLVSSGLNTFDASNVPAVSNLSAASLTNTVQTLEGISGQYELSTYYNTSSLSGAPANFTLTTAGTAYSDIAICSPATIGSLSSVVGICNGAPGQQGSYLIAGLSYGAWTTPIRTDSFFTKPFQVKTYGVSLSDNLPAFNITVGSSQIAISPSCRADPTGSGTYTTCYIGSVRVGAQHTYSSTTSTGYNTYGLVPTATYPNVGSFYFVWEDSQYGSDHDQDANNVISYCVGSSCNLPSQVVTGGVAICDPVVISTSSSPVVTSVWGGACNSSGQLKVTPGANDIVIRNQLTAYSSNGMLLGYQVSGTSADGLLEFKVTNGGSNTGTTQNGAVFNCNLLGNINCKSSPEVERFTLGTTAAVSTLQSPLWYAAKYSGFTGSAPSLPTGQDPPNYFFARNAGALKAQLDTVFQAITSSAANNFGNATTPSSSNDIKGNGVSYQVQYFQQRNGVKWTGNLQALWIDSSGYEREGSVDSSGNQVLDAVNAPYVVAGPDNSANALPGAMTSYICSVPPVAPAGGTFDPTSSANASSCSPVSVSSPLTPAWDATTLLNASYDPATTAGAAAIANIGTQRAYNADASASGNLGQRYIFTYLSATPNGSSSNGTLIGGTQTDFVWNDASCNASGSYTLSSTSGFCGKYDATNKVRTGNFGLLNEQNPLLAQDLLLWIRGNEDPNYRSRVSTTTTSPATYRLGDIVDSSPAIVGTPAESYDLLYSDFSYAAFRSNYQSRRQMVYVGANDGMLHAFNGGFYLTGQAATSTTAATKPSLLRQLTTSSKLSSGDSSAPLGNNWSLGQEVWAFIPDNLLAHLRWLADKKYTHVFYVDGSPVISDVKIFGAGNSAGCLAGNPSTASGSTDIDAKGHVCGWGTVMVVPFRLGGGPISVGVTGSGSTSDTQMSNSAYVIMDVTDPEQPPTVLGEITTGTFTSSAPAFAVHKESDGQLHFLLTIGSGSFDNGGALGNKPVSAPAGGNLGVWVYDLKNVYSGTTTPAASFTTTGPANSFAGDMVSADFNLNDSAESVYFGVVTNPPPASVPPAAPVPQVYGGGMWKLDLRDSAATIPDVSDPGKWTLKEVINVGKPVTIRPTVALDSAQRPTVFFGTGRSFTTNDNSGTSDQGTQTQAIYGVVDNRLLTNLPSACQAEATINQLFNASTTTVVLNSNGTNTVTGSGLSNISNLASLDTALLGVSTTSGPTVGCYTYSGWILPLAPGNSTANVQQPSERVINSQTLLGGILTTPTYIPPNLAMLTAAHTSACNPVPVPGTSYVYGLDYLTGSASSALASFFGTSTNNGVTTLQSRVSLGSGQASAPVLHVGSTIGGAQTVKACFNVGGVTVCKDISALNAVSSGEISWREPEANL
ncbi:pilus assembly protein [Dyella sp. Tek66A03]|uniref:pilus assembly protein n=1 Tax=Dyella sp. Tek66A03 TaxID=3458298 RepID=UPI00403EC7F9